jgi:ATP-dependent Clp protease ATP-binding subunit ClpC
MSRNLPEFPNLDYLKKQAKILLRELQQRNPKAKLTQAQHAIAREYGFASWPKLKAHVESLPPRMNPSAAAAAAPHGGGGGMASGPTDRHDNVEGGGDLFPRFTEKAKRTIFFARYFALRESKTVEAEHLLLGVIQADEDLVNRLLPGQFQARPAPRAEEMAQLKASLSERITKLLQQLGRPTTANENLSRTGDSPLSSECRRVLDHARTEADRLRHPKIDTGHFLLAFLREEVTPATAILRDIFKEKGIRLDMVRDQITRFLSEQPL